MPVSDRLPEPQRGKRSEHTYEQRFGRYAANAQLSAEHGDRGAHGWGRSAFYAQQAAENAEANGDPEAARLYTEMADAARDVADACQNFAAAARDIAEHYGG